MDWKVGMKVRSTYAYNYGAIGTIKELNTYTNSSKVKCHRIKWDIPTEYDKKDFTPEFLIPLNKLERILT